MQLIKNITILSFGLLLAACEKSSQSSVDAGHAELESFVVASMVEEQPAQEAAAVMLAVDVQQKLKDIILNPKTSHDDVLRAKQFFLASTGTTEAEALQFIQSHEAAVLRASDLNPEKKISFLKQLYLQQLDDELMDVDLIKLYGSAEIRKLIEQRDLIADQYPGDMCDWVRPILIPGSGDHDFNASSIEYTALSNGRIRVEAVNFGEKFSIDFEIDCQGERCKINDIFDPNSYKNELKDIVKHERCG